MIDLDVLDSISEVELLSVMPESASELTKFIQINSVVKMINKFGGIRLCIPKIAKPQHQLVELIGYEDFSKLCEIYSGEEIDIPKAVKLRQLIRNKNILACRAKGMSLSKLARYFDLTERGVSKIIRRMEKIK